MRSRKNGCIHIQSKCIVTSIRDAYRIFHLFSARPWDSHNDISTYEKNFIICTRTQHHSHPCANHVSPLSTVVNRERQSMAYIHSPSDDDVPLMLKRIESSLIRTNQRLSLYEKDIHHLQQTQLMSGRDPNYLLSPNVQFLLLLLVVPVILKYIFRWTSVHSPWQVDRFWRETEVAMVDDNMFIINCVNGSFLCGSVRWNAVYCLRMGILWIKEKLIQWKSSWQWN